MSTFVQRVLRKIGYAAIGSLLEDLKDDLGGASRADQMLLYNTYKEMAARGIVPKLSEVGFRCHSEFEEDGILLFIFALIGTTNRTAVEICAGDGITCMTANLILNHGWWGYLFDGDERNVKRGTAVYHKSRDTFLYPPRFTRAWITAENVNDIIYQSGIAGEVDLLSLDMDGMDYWVWKALDCIKPRVVVCESHNIIGPDDALTVPYDPNFVRSSHDYSSASLAAMTKLADEKGYRLIGTHRFGFNAFFILKEIAPDVLPGVEPAECLQDPYTLEGQATRWPKVRDLRWVRV